MSKNLDALSGIRVTDFCWAIAGPVTGELLAALGAEVIKIESMSRLDLSRVMHDPATGQVQGLNRRRLFNDLNINKLSARLNLRHPQGIELAKALVSISDVVVNNFAPGVMDRLGLGYQVMRQVKPDIVMLSISTCGSIGPEKDTIGYAPIFAALSGMSEMTGYLDGPPTEIRASMDYIGSYTSVVSILSALVHRRRTGKGQHIDLALREAISSLMGDSFLDYFVNRRVQSRQGNLDDIFAPHNCYRCKGEDQWVSIAVATDKEWDSLIKIMGDPPWAREERFSDVYSRWCHQEELDNKIENWTMNYSPYEVMDRLQGVGVAAVACFTPEDLFIDPHLKERGAYTVMHHPEAGDRFSLSFPWKLSGTPLKIRHDSPLFGEHTEYVFGELLGLSQERVQELKDEKVLY